MIFFGNVIVVETCMGRLVMKINPIQKIDTKYSGSNKKDDKKGKLLFKGKLSFEDYSKQQLVVKKVND